LKHVGDVVGVGVGVRVRVGVGVEGQVPVPTGVQVTVGVGVCVSVGVGVGVDVGVGVAVACATGAAEELLAPPLMMTARSSRNAAVTPIASRPIAGPRRVRAFVVHPSL